MTQTLQIPHYIDVDPERLDAELNEEQLAFEHFRQSFTTEEMGSIRVQRIPMSQKGNSNPGAIRGIHCFSCPVDQYTFDGLLDYVRDNYGGGMYRIMGTKSGKKGQAFNRLCEIAEPRRIDSDGRQESTGGNVSAILDTLGVMIQQSADRTEKLLLAANPAMQNADPFGALEKMVNVMAGLGLVGGKGGGGDGLAEIERFIKLKSLIGELGGGGGDERGGDPGFYGLLTETVKQFGGPLLMAVQAGTKDGQISRTPVMQPKQPSKTIEQETKPPKSSAKQMAQMQEMKKQVDILVMNARANVNPEDFAAIVYNMTPDDKLDELHNFMRADNCIETLTKLNGEVQILLPWFQTLRTSLLRLLDESLVDDTLQFEDDGVIVSEAVTGDDGKESAQNAAIELAPTIDAAPTGDDAASDS